MLNVSRQEQCGCRTEVFMDTFDRASLRGLACAVAMVFVGVGRPALAGFQSLLQTPNASVAVTTSGDVWTREADAGCDGIWRLLQCSWNFAGSVFGGLPGSPIVGLAWASAV